jgi:hypothetical protein
MPEENLSCWEELEEKLRDFENKSRDLAYPEKYLYRGHEKKSYKLETTLERYIGRCISLKDYYNFIYSAKYEIQSYHLVPKLHLGTAMFAKLSLAARGRSQAQLGNES